MEKSLSTKIKVYIAWVVAFFIIIIVQKVTPLNNRQDLNLAIYIAFQIIFLLYCIKNRKDLAEDKKGTTKAKIIVCSILFILIMIRLFSRIWLNINYPSSVNKTNITSMYVLKWFCIFLVSSFCEEILFKKILYKKLLKPYMKEVVAIMSVSIIFSLWHFNASVITYIFTICYQVITLFMYEKYPNIYLYVMAHFFWNFSSLI